MPAHKGNKYAVGNKGNTAKKIVVTRAMVVSICEEIAKGDNIRKILDRNPAYPKWDCFRKAKSENEDFNALYVKALQDKAEMEVCDMDDVCEELKNGTLDPASANVIIQTKKWKCAKFYPKMYGEKMDVTSGGEKLRSINVQITDD